MRRAAVVDVRRAEARGFVPERSGGVLWAAGVAAMVSLCGGMAGASGLTCLTGEGADPDGAGMLCQALGAALADDGLSSDGLTLEVKAARADRVAARLRWRGQEGPWVQVVAMDGPLLPDWPARLAAELLRATPPP